MAAQTPTVPAARRAFYRRSRTTRIEMNAFGLLTTRPVRHLHHTGEQRQVNDLQQPAREIVPHGDSRISERHHHFSLCVFSLALLLPRAAVPGAGARPPRRAALALLPLVLRTRTRPSLALVGRFPAALFFLLASRCAARHAASFRNFAAPARTDDRRTNDATSGPQEWLTGRLHRGEYGANAHRCGGPPSSRPLSPLPCNAAVPKGPSFLFNFSRHCFFRD
jgi:hypothetical protein